MTETRTVSTRPFELLFGSFPKGCRRFFSYFGEPVPPDDKHLVEVEDGLPLLSSSSGFSSVAIVRPCFFLLLPSERRAFFF